MNEQQEIKQQLFGDEELDYLTQRVAETTRNRSLAENSDMNITENAKMYINSAAGDIQKAIEILAKKEIQPDAIKQMQSVLDALGNVKLLFPQQGMKGPPKEYEAPIWGGP